MGRGALASAALKVDDRALHRTRVLLNANLITRSGVVRVRVRDISGAGAQVWSERPLTEDSEALLVLNGKSAAARVIWADERYAGLGFFRQVSTKRLCGL